MNNYISLSTSGMNNIFSGNLQYNLINVLNLFDKFNINVVEIMLNNNLTDDLAIALKDIIEKKHFYISSVHLQKSLNLSSYADVEQIIENILAINEFTKCNKFIIHPPKEEKNIIYYNKLLKILFLKKVDIVIMIETIVTNYSFFRYFDELMQYNNFGIVLDIWHLKKRGETSYQYIKYFSYIYVAHLCNFSDISRYNNFKNLTFIKENIDYIKCIFPEIIVTIEHIYSNIYDLIAIANYVDMLKHKTIANFR